MKIFFTKDELNLICEYLKTIRNDVDEYCREEIYGVYWKLSIALSNSEESLVLRKDEVILLGGMLFYTDGKKLNDVFIKIAEELRAYHALNGYYYTADGLEAIEF